MNQTQIKKEVLDYLASATACINTEVLQWSGLIGVTDWYSELFADTQITQSVLDESCQNPYGLIKPGFIKVFQDKWASYPLGYILESDGTLIAKILRGEEMELWYSSLAPSYGSTSSGGLVKVGSIGCSMSSNFNDADTQVKLSKGLYVYNSITGLYCKAASSTMQDAGDCATFEFMNKLNQPKIALAGDSKLRKDLEQNQYLYTGFEGFLEFSVARGLCSENDADDIHRIIHNAGARLGVADWYKWHKKDALAQTWLRLYRWIKKE